MSTASSDKLYVLTSDDALTGELGEDLRALVASCEPARTDVAAEATFALGIGSPDAWTSDTDWLSPEARCYVWFAQLMEPEDYTAALDRLPHAEFLHGVEGLRMLRGILVDWGLSDSLREVDAAGVDALFDLKGQYLTGLHEEFEKFLLEKPDTDPALSAEWRRLLQRVEGSAGTYEFTDLSDAAARSRALFAVMPVPAGAEQQAIENVHEAIEFCRVTHSRQATERLPARIEHDVRYRVLIIADEPTTSRQLRLALNHSRLEALHHNVPNTFYEALRLVQPDVLVIEQSLRNFDGLDLAAQVRDDDSFSAIPIVAILDDTSEQTRNRAMRCGVDSFLIRPFSAESAVLAVVNMLRRLEAEQQLGGRDPVTGLYSRQGLEDRLELELLRARRSGELVGLMLVHIDAARDGLYPRQQLLQLAQTVEATFRKSDVLARYNERTIAIVLPGADPRVVMSLRQRLLDSVDVSLDVQVAASIAEGAVSPPMLMADAETRLIQVLDGQPGAAVGRCLSRREDGGDTGQAPRVLLVDNDEAILTLLRFFCAREGFIVDEVRDGLSAIEYLERAQRASALPDLIVMEAYLPGVDGFSVLRKVHADFGSRIAVMMLTVQRNEERIAKAFQLGAADFVAKPFAVPEVMARIKNILVRSGAL